MLDAHGHLDRASQSCGHTTTGRVRQRIRRAHLTRRSVDSIVAVIWLVSRLEMQLVQPAFPLESSREPRKRVHLIGRHFAPSAVRSEHVSHRSPCSVERSGSTSPASGTFVASTGDLRGVDETERALAHASRNLRKPIVEPMRPMPQPMSSTRKPMPIASPLVTRKVDTPSACCCATSRRSRSSAPRPIRTQAPHRSGPARTPRP